MTPSPKTYRILALAFYLLIMLMGQMIAAPFFLWLLFTLFDFGNVDQVFAVLAVAGLVLVCLGLDKARTPKTPLLDVLYFLLLASPLVKRMSSVPLRLFNYPSFIIPAAAFVAFYMASLVPGCRFRVYRRKASG